MTAYDALIVGAGVCGSTLARSLGNAGYSVALVDKDPVCRPVFKAEKIEPDQVRLLHDLGALEIALQVATPIRHVTVARSGAIEKVLDICQYGVAYEDVANALRQSLPGSVTLIGGKVAKVIPSLTAPSIDLASGERINARIVVFAIGVGSQKLFAPLGVSFNSIRNDHSVCGG
ncbi:MAG: FAD-dependent monooxygenase, partial [Gammaproteobacteria bacterium]|nr:FAD-dependent monooxygenase [Gammaproteobacteria bacterium]